MEEMTEVDFEGKKFVWDGQAWCDAKTYMVPPDDIVNKLNAVHRKDEVTLSPGPRARAPKKTAAPRGEAPKKFVPIKPKKEVAEPSARTVEKLTAYEGDNAFLAGDYPATVYYEEHQYPSIDAAVSAIKEVHDRLRLNMQREWDEEKRVPLMRKLLLSKFSHPELRAKLLATDDKHLSHQAAGSDPFWNAPEGKGENMLGRLIMELRAMMNKQYHLLSDDQIVEHLRGYREDNLLVPDQALASAKGWKRVSELLDLYKNELPKDLRAVLEKRRDSAKALSGGK